MAASLRMFRRGGLQAAAPRRHHQDQDHPPRTLTGSRPRRQTRGGLGGPLAAPLLAVAAVLPLSGCERPLPAVTVAADAGSVRVEASSWCPAATDEETCLTRKQPVPTLAAHPGGWMIVNVDEQIAERGWRVLVDGQPQPPVLTGRTAYRLEARHLLPGERKTIEVQALDGSGPAGRATGSWTFHILPR